MQRIVSVDVDSLNLVCILHLRRHHRDGQLPALAGNRIEIAS
jgi:hypothetical protein